MTITKAKPEVVQSLDRPDTQRQINAQLAEVGKTGRRVVLAYIGLWGCAYDRAAGMYDGGVRLWQDAAARGQRMEEALTQRLRQTQQRATRQFDRLQNHVGDNVEQVTRTVTDTGETVEDQVEKQVERVLVNLGIPTRDRLERLNQEIDRLNAKLDEELARQQVVPA